MECIKINTLIWKSFGISLNILPPGHAALLQASASVLEPLHSAPPFAAGSSSVLVRVLVPSPHVVEQADHSPYSPHTQSTTLENDARMIKIY